MSFDSVGRSLQRAVSSPPAPKVEPAAPQTQARALNKGGAESVGHAARDAFTPAAQQNPVDLTGTAGLAPAPDKAQDKTVPDALKDFAGRNLDVAQLLKDGKLKDALGTTLNSVGDSLTFKLGAEGTGGEGVNVGGGASGEVKLTKTDDGYELTVQGEGKLTAGAEVYADTEANAEGAIAVTPKFKFKTLEEAQQGLEAVARTGSKAVTTPALFAGEYAVDTAAGAVEKGAHSASDKVEKVPILGKYAAKGLDMVGDAAGKVDDRSKVSEDTNFLRDHLSSVTVQGSEAAELALSLNFGADVSNLGAAAKGKGTMTQSLEIEFTKPPTASYDAGVKLEAKANAGAGVGVAADASVEVKTHTKMELNKDFNPLDLFNGKKPSTPGKVTESTTTIETDTRGRVLAGAGVSVDVGTGLKTSITADNQPGQNGIPKALTSEALDSLLQGDPKPLVKNLGDTPVTLKASFYGTSGANLLVGGSEGGNGGKVEGEARWTDVLSTKERKTTAKDVVGDMADLTERVTGKTTALSSAFKAGVRQAVAA